MARQKGTLRVGSNIEAQMNAPLDARQRVALKADLTVAESFPFFWVGMEVYVADEDAYYQLIAEPTTAITSWRKREAGQGGGGSTLETGIEVTEDVGGLHAGDSFAAGDSIESVLQQMLSPLKYPTLNGPSASLAFASGSNNLVEDGTAEIRKNIVCTFNRGSISPAYGTSGYRSGPATTYTDNQGGAAQDNGTYNNFLFPASGSVSVTVDYEAGEQPKDSKGGNYDQPLPASNVTSNSLSVVIVNALWSNAADITNIAKMALFNTSSTKSKEFNFPTQSVANPEVFDIPASLTVTKIEVKSDLSGLFEDCSSEFTVSNVTHPNAGGADVNYKRYTDNRGYAAGPRTIKVTWS